MNRFVFICILSVGLSGCFDTDDNNTANSGNTTVSNYAAFYDVQVLLNDAATDGITERVVANARFFEENSTVGGSSTLGLQTTLADGEQVFIEYGPILLALDLDDSNANDPVYRGQLTTADPDGDPADGVDVDFRLDQSRFFGVGAESSGIELANAFTMTTPASGASFANDAQIDVTWTQPAGFDIGSTFFRLDATCGSVTATFERNIVTDEIDTETLAGRLIFTPNNIFPELAFDQNCSLDIGISVLGANPVIDQSLSSFSNIFGVVTRVVSLTITP